MILHRSLADADIGCDVLARMTSENERHNLVLPFGETGKSSERLLVPGLQLRPIA